MVERLVEIARTLPPEIGVAFLSMIPVTELRAGIPIGIWTLGVPWWSCFFWAVLGNIIPVPIILLGLRPLSRLFYRTKWGTRFFEWLYIRAKKKGASIEKYESLGLYVFVAIPLPGTGAWTGALVASALGMRFLPGLIAIGLGVATAGVIVTALSVLGWWGAIIAGVLVMGGVVWNYLRK
ncbi:MAG: small multi-drug export protein [candidate division WOR-3 bacterium]